MRQIESEKVVVGYSTVKKNVAGETEEKHTAPSNFPAGFFPPHFGVKSTPALSYLFLYSDVMDCSGKRLSHFPARGINTV